MSPSASALLGRFAAAPSESIRLGGGAAAAAAAALLTAAALFAAAHWIEWPPMLRTAVFGCAALVSALPLLSLKRLPNGSLRRDGAALLHGLLLGLFLIVIGQTWQSGAGGEALMLSWSLLLLPWVVAVRGPLVFSLWFAAASTGLALQGAALSGLHLDERLLDDLLPASLFTVIWTAALPLAARFRQQHAAGSAGGRLRSAAVLPELLFLFLASALPAGLLAVLGLSESSPLLPLYGLLFAAGAAALLASRTPEGAALVVIGAAFWICGLAMALMPGDAALFPCAVILAAGLILAGRLSSMRAQTEAQRLGRSAPAASSLLPKAAAALAGACFVLALLLLVFSVLNVPAGTAALIFLGAGLAAEALRSFAEKSDRRCASCSALRLFARLFCAAGFLFSLLYLSDAALSGTALRTATIGIVLALLLRSRLALFAGFATAAGFDPSIFPDLAHIALLLTAAACAALLSPQASRRRFARRALTPLLLFLFLASLADLPESPLAELSWHTDWGTADILIVAAAAAAAAAAALKKRATTGFRAVCAALLFILLAATLSVWSAPLTLSLLAAASASLGARQTPPKDRYASELLLFFIALSIASCGCRYALAPSDAGINLLAAAACSQAVLAAILLSAALVLAAPAWPGFVRESALNQTPDAPAPQLPAAASALQRRPFAWANAALALAALLISAALCGQRIAADESLLANGSRYEAALLPTDPRDILMGDYAALRYDLGLTEADIQAAAQSALADGGHPGRLTACLALQKGRLVMTGAADPEIAQLACPADTALQVPLRAGSPQLPRRWFFPSGEAERYEAARYAALRCSGRRCLLEALLDQNRQIIRPRQ